MKRKYIRPTSKVYILPSQPKLLAGSDDLQKFPNPILDPTDII